MFVVETKDSPQTLVDMLIVYFDTLGALLADDIDQNIRKFGDGVDIILQNHEAVLSKVMEHRSFIPEILTRPQTTKTFLRLTGIQKTEIDSFEYFEIITQALYMLYNGI